MSGVLDQLSGAQGIRTAGKSAQNIAEYDAQVAEQEGKAAELRSAFDQQRQVEAADIVRGQIAADIGATGTAGSPVTIDIKKKQAEESELEMLLIGYEGEWGAQQAKSSAALSRLQGKLARQTAKSQARRAQVGFGLQLASLATA